MKRFWNNVVGPILEVLQPRVIVEIGSAKGVNTENLLQYCRRHDALLHVIDPAPLYDAEEWQEETNGRLIFHRGLSLDVLPEIEEFDAVLIDGDHNWYTVFNELKQIEQKSLQNSRDFPLVLLHDVGWPYGRRDLYYDPVTIPEEHRKPYEKKGILWGVSGLVDEGGMNQHLDNAVEENEPEEGVLTAIEDFMGETSYEVELLKLPGVHGLGILTTKRLKEETPRLAELLEDLDFPQHVRSYVEGLERARLERETYHQKERREHRQRLAEESSKLREQRRMTGEAHSKLREANPDLARLTRWIETLDDGVSAILHSRRWRLGGVAAGLYRKARPVDKKPAVEKRLKTVSEEFHAWREEHRNQGEDTGEKNRSGRPASEPDG